MAGAYVSRYGIFAASASIARNPILLIPGSVYRGLQCKPESGRYPYERVGVGAPELFRLAGFQLTTGIRPDPRDPNRRHRLTLVVPLWFVALLTAIAPARAVTRYIRQRRRGLDAPRLCRTCSYDLTGNVSGVCPECGTRIE